MCESGKQCYEGKSCGARADQLKKLIWALMIWVFVLSLGLGASVTLQIILHQGSDATSPQSTRSQLVFYDCFGEATNANGPEPERILLWQKKNEDNKEKESTIKIEDDGDYFLFLRVDLQSQKPGVSYSVRVMKATDSNVAELILEGSINDTQNSTGLMGIGAILIRNTLISVIYSPPANLDVRNSYLGLIKF